jgi:hypothetical protein
MAEQEAGSRILLSANCPNGDELKLVMYKDGGCGITRNGVAQPGWLWKPCQMCEATKGLLDLAALAGRVA